MCARLGWVTASSFGPGLYTLPRTAPCCLPFSAMPAGAGTQTWCASDERSAILWPAFKTDPWKGRSRIKDLETLTMTEVRAPGDDPDTVMADIRGELAVCVTSDGLLLANR